MHALPPRSAPDEHPRRPAPGEPASTVPPVIPHPETYKREPTQERSLRKIFKEDGAEAFAKAVRERRFVRVVCRPVVGGANAINWRGMCWLRWSCLLACFAVSLVCRVPTLHRKAGKVLITDTTWRDAHQSLLATRVRTIDLLAIGARACSAPAGWRSRCRVRFVYVLHPYVTWAFAFVSCTGATQLLPRRKSCGMPTVSSAGAAQRSTSP